MSLASEKARYYLERSIPELKELEKKKLFSEDEIASIIRRRTEFEHKLNARGSTPADYARYAEFEMNLEALRKKRTKRLDVKLKSYAGTRRIFFILERSTKKFPGDVGLWMQYIEALRREGAHKKVEEALSSVLRLHPAKSALWIYSAKYYIEAQSDVNVAREHLQKGLRFCSHQQDYWLEYLKVEIMFTARIWQARQTIGFGASETEAPAGGQLDDLGRGAIPLAVFDSAMAAMQMESFAESFLDIVAGVENEEAARHMSSHIIDYMLQTWPESYRSQAAYVRQPLIGISTSSPEFPRALRDCISRSKPALAKTSDPSSFVTALAPHLTKLAEKKDLDSSIRSAVLLIIQSLMQSCESLPELGSSTAATVCGLLQSSSETDVQEMGGVLLDRAIKRWPKDQVLQEQRSVIIH